MYLSVIKKKNHLSFWPKRLSEQPNVSIHSFKRILLKNICLASFVVIFKYNFIPLIYLTWCILLLVVRDPVCRILRRNVTLDRLEISPLDDLVTSQDLTNISYSFCYPDIQDQSNQLPINSIDGILVQIRLYPKLWPKNCK